jgi:hypothetical protein
MKIDPLHQAKEITQALASESDRGCVLVGAAWIEDLMRTMIRDEIEFLCQTRDVSSTVPKDIKSLLKTIVDGAMNRAANRVAFIRATGMIDDRLRNSMNALFLMRNEFFAHFPGRSSLSAPQVSQRLKEFCEINPTNDETFTASLGKQRYSHGRRRFLNAFSLLAYQLITAITRQIDGHSDEFRRQRKFWEQEKKRLSKTTLTKQQTAELLETVEQMQAKLLSLKYSSRAPFSQTTKTASRATSDKSAHKSRKGSGT